MLPPRMLFTAVEVDDPLPVDDVLNPASVATLWPWWPPPCVRFGSDVCCAAGLLLMLCAELTEEATLEMDMMFPVYRSMF